MTSVSGDTLYLHAVNLRPDITFEIEADIGTPVKSMTAHEIAPSDPMTEVTPQNSGVFDPIEKTITGGRYVLPPAGVAAIEIKL